MAISTTQPDIRSALARRALSFSCWSSWLSLASSACMALLNFEMSNFHQYRRESKPK
ncbi:hypothetical protein D3C85_1676080 [compost metagenome]